MRVYCVVRERTFIVDDVVTPTRLRATIRRNATKEKGATQGFPGGGHRYKGKGKNSDWKIAEKATSDACIHRLNNNIKR